jgi:hypothetical protein
MVYGALFESRIIPPEVCSHPVGGGVVAAVARGGAATATPVRASPAATAMPRSAAVTVGRFAPAWSGGFENGFTVPP